jgi:RNA polymerase sigma-70 factor (ECF subfamily)
MESFKTDFLKEVSDCQAMLHQVCNVYSSSKEEKEDLFQEVLYQLWKSYPSFERKSKFSTWLYRVALNTAITYYGKIRKLSGHELHVEDFPDLNEESRGADQRIDEMYKAINKLGKIDKALILLFLEDKKYQDMAEILGMTTSNVGVRLLRARKKLETLIK